VCSLGAEGNLWCLDAQNGQVIWSVDFAKDYAAQTPFWGVAGHPLVDSRPCRLLNPEPSAAGANPEGVAQRQFELWKLSGFVCTVGPSTQGALRDPELRDTTPSA
jgi:hypothetical protein